MSVVNVKKLRQVSSFVRKSKEKQTKQSLRNIASKDEAETKRIAKEIIDGLPELLKAESEAGSNSLTVCSMEVRGKIDDLGWLVYLGDCDAAKNPKKYLCGYLKIVYEVCKKIKGLKVDFHHEHREGDIDHCYLSIVVSW